jgi:hypothetical protein
MCRVMTIPAVAAALFMLASAAAARPSAVDRQFIMAQGGFTFGGRDDLGPRYDPYSERWGPFVPTDARACRWVAVRTPLPSGKIGLWRQRLCGFKVPARDQPG